MTHFMSAWGCFGRVGAVGGHLSTAKRAWWVALVVAAMSAMSPLALAAGKAPAPARTWTLQDIAAAPQVTDLSISDDGRYALYIVRRGDLHANAKRSSLHWVDLSSGAQRPFAESAWLSGLQRIPHAAGWSLLADLGEGVQLYRVDGNGRLEPLHINRQVDYVGAGDEGTHAFGISDYGWAPDGNSYWYVARTSRRPDPRVVNPRYLPLSTRNGTGPIELRVRTGTEDVLVEQAEAGSAGFVRLEWQDQSSSLTYWTRVRKEDALEQRRWTRGVERVEVVDRQSAHHVPVRGARGPGGGVLGTMGFGTDRMLVETLPDGSKLDYGHAGFMLGDSRSSGAWLSPAGDIALVGTRYFDVPRYGLVRLARSGEMEELASAGSLTQCTVNFAFDAGVCVRQSMVSPPELVRFDPRNGQLTPVVSLAPDYVAIAPLRVVPRTWTNRAGYKASGFVVYPRHYQKGRKYPVILVTHGSDADERFVDAGFQWDYPVQAWAERGYFVLAINDPTVLDSAELRAAYAQWSAPGPLPIERVQDLIWLNGVDSFETAVDDLVGQGLVNAEQVGIAGYSRGSQMVNVVMTQSKVFRAASSGDGGYLEPSGYFSSTSSYRYVFGGSPYDPAAFANYRRLSPTFRVEMAAGPVLQQVASGSTSQFALHMALREHGVPSELVYYPNESHLFHQPQHRLLAMQENLDWFDFWLLGKEDTDPAKASQYQRWRQMRSEWHAATVGLR